ncbi:MAG: threonine ammonia-lyase IlvA [Bacteroidota bacterium]
MEDQTATTSLISLDKIMQARANLRQVALHTPLMRNFSLSAQYGCNLLLKREDLQQVRSYKIRGAYNRMCYLTPVERSNGVVCASAGNHAQGVALACQLLAIKGSIYMPRTTPMQKVERVKHFGREMVDVVLHGDTFDDAYEKAMEACGKNGQAFIHPFNDPHVIEGQATVGLEILEDANVSIDYVLVAIGGGGLASGLGSYFKQLSPKTQIIGIEPAGAPAMTQSLEQGQRVKLNEIDRFVDGAAVKMVGNHTFQICNQVIDRMLLVPEGKVCSTILQLYNEEAIVAEPAGALTIAALDQLRQEIKGKNIVCILSGGNNDITRTEEIQERALLYEGRKHYFIIRFPQRPGALKHFVNKVLGPDDDIAHFEYTKKINRETGPALVGIQLQRASDFDRLIRKLEASGFDYESINKSPLLFDLLI